MSLNDWAKKLGIENDSVIKKADELIRVLSTKGGIIKLSDGVKHIICLDIASSMLGENINKDIAFKLAGLKRSAYVNHLNNCEKILNVTKQLTISKLCVQCNCTVVSETAELILNHYKKKSADFKDFSHPQYVTAAVYTACRLKNVKVIRSQFISLSRLKPSQWKELENEFTDFSKSLEISTKKKLIVNLESAELMDQMKDNSLENNSGEAEVEDYETWKERILNEARLALGMKTN